MRYTNVCSLPGAKPLGYLSADTSVPAANAAMLNAVVIERIGQEKDTRAKD